MTMLVIPASSTDYAKVPIDTDQDPTALPVRWSVVAENGAPGPWVNGTWLTPVEIGPGRWRTYTTSPVINHASGIALAGVGLYEMYVSLNTGAATPVRHVGYLRVDA